MAKRTHYTIDTPTTDAFLDVELHGCGPDGLTFEEFEAAKLAAMTPDERAAYKSRPLPPLPPLDLDK